MGRISLFGAILLFAGITQINGGKPISQNFPQINGRLLTPEEGCGFTKVKNNRIIGGSEAKIGAWPWMALLGYKSDVEEKEIEMNLLCGGSLITSRHVLTAAHCVDPKEIPLFVRLGEHQFGTTDDGQHQDILIDSFVAHEKYDDSLQINDIAMLYLQRDVEFSDRIRPICLPLDEPLQSRSFIDANPFVAGWGSEIILFNPSQALMQVQAPVVEPELCKHAMELMKFTRGPDHQYNDHVVCTRPAYGKGLIYGDSGGPLMLPVFQNGLFPFYQIGIASQIASINENNNQDSLNIYTKVQYHAYWIKKQLKNLTENAHSRK